MKSQTEIIQDFEIFEDWMEKYQYIIDLGKELDKLDDVVLTAVTIRERAIQRAIEAKKEGYGPDRILLMVSTSESHQYKNSGLYLKDYWKMSEEWIKKAKKDIMANLEVLLSRKCYIQM